MSEDAIFRPPSIDEMRGKLDALIDILDVSLENALEDQEKKFLISY